MKERPIIFSAPMVRAILDGRKTQTRRVFKDTPEDFDDDLHPFVRWKDDRLHRAACPYGKAGDQLWVRETFSTDADNGEYIFKADGEAVTGGRWAPSIHMPRKASRITLEITAIRVDRLQDISEEDAEAEGCLSDGDECGRVRYSILWDEINGDGAWEKNQWVWVIEFKRVKT